MLSQISLKNLYSCLLTAFLLAFYMLVDEKLINPASVDLESCERYDFGAVEYLLIIGILAGAGLALQYVLINPILSLTRRYMTSYKNAVIFTGIGLVLLLGVVFSLAFNRYEVGSHGFIEDFLKGLLLITLLVGGNLFSYFTEAK